MENEEWKKEYIMADSGLIWRGSHNRMRPCAWNFAQFEKDILECSVYLLSNIGKLTIAGRAGINTFLDSLKNQRKRINLTLIF